MASDCNAGDLRWQAGSSYDMMKLTYKTQLFSSQIWLRRMPRTRGACSQIRS